MTENPESTEPLRIISLEAENVKRLKAVRINPDRTLQKIEGKNGAGKTSVIDAIAAALGGGKRCPEMPVRKGERRAHVVVDLGDVIVTRRWTDKGHTSLEVTNKEGVLQRSPQALLDKLVGDLTFDPLEFIKCAPAVQQRILMELAGLDFEELDEKREIAYDNRTHVNRNLKHAKALIGTVPDISRDAAIIDIAAMAEENERIQESNQARAAQEGTVNAVKGRLEMATGSRSEASKKYYLAVEGCTQAQERLSALDPEIDIVELVAQLDAARAHNQIREQLRSASASADMILNERHAQHKQIATSHTEAAKELEEVQTTLSEMPPHVAADGIASKLEEATAHNALVNDRATWAERDRTVTDLDTRSDELTKAIEAIDDEKAKRMREAEFPLPNLTVTDDGVLLNGIPLSDASQAEQIHCAVAIGLSGDVRARIALIRDGSLLDDDSMEILRKIAEDMNAQVFVERVSSTASPSAVFIEDGEVAC